MIERINKYKVYEDDKDFNIRYVYTFSDIIGSIIYILGVLIGVLFIITAWLNFDVSTIWIWIALIVGVFFVLFFLLMIIVGLYNPKAGIFQIRKDSRQIIIRDFYKSETLNIKNCAGISYDLIDKYHGTGPKREVYAMIKLNMRNGTQKDCFIVRSSIPFDLGRSLQKEIHNVSRQLRDRINATIVNLERKH